MDPRTPCRASAATATLLMALEYPLVEPPAYTVGEDRGSVRRLEKEQARVVDLRFHQ